MDGERVTRKAAFGCRGKPVARPILGAASTRMAARSNTGASWSGSFSSHREQIHVLCNWQLNPTGTHAGIAKIETLIDGLRMDHPIISRER